MLENITPKEEQPNMESKWKEIRRTEVTGDDRILKDDTRFEGPEWEVIAEGPAQAMRDYTNVPHNLLRTYRTRKYRDRKIQQADGTEVDMWCTQELPYHQRDLTTE
jgi:hypothetical protein